MKKLSIIKIFQLSVLAILSLISIFFLLSPDVKQYIFSTAAASILFGVVWVVLIASFAFLLVDFSFISSIKLNYHNLYEVAYSDPLSGMPNRFSCDILIEKYLDQKLPDSIGCIMIDLTNLPEINSLYNHAVGNSLLKEFSKILSSASLSLCFVGRNGGNKFLAIFEECTETKLEDFLQRVQERVEHHNAGLNAVAIEYRAGSALNSSEHLPHITQLISLANHRIYQQ